RGDRHSRGETAKARAGGKGQVEGVGQDAQQFRVVLYGSHRGFLAADHGELAVAEQVANLGAGALRDEGQHETRLGVSGRVQVAQLAVHRILQLAGEGVEDPPV